MRFIALMYALAEASNTSCAVPRPLAVAENAVLREEGPDVLVPGGVVGDEGDVRRRLRSAGPEKDQREQRPTFAHRPLHRWPPATLRLGP